MSKADREYYKRLAAVQKEYTPEKWDARKPYNWKKEWGPFIKYDADWDGEYFLDLTLFKLEKIYISLDIYSDEYRRDLNKKLKILRQIINLGKQLKTKDYYVESSNFSEEHFTHLVYIYEKQSKENIQLTKDDKLLATVPSSRTSVEDIADGDELSADELLGALNAIEWIKENGYTRDQVHFLYGGEWDTPENRELCHKMAKKEARQEQKDTDQFFKLISRNYRDWWW